MIETWLYQDIKKTFDRGYTRFVLSDLHGEASYLLSQLPKNWTVLEAHSELDELHAKYLAETEHADTPVVFYTRIPVEKLTFLMEYAMIGGNLPITQFQQYIKKQVHKHTGFNLNLVKEDLLTAAKVSVGKDKTYWMDLSHKGSGEIFDLREMLLPFLHEPESFASSMHATVKKAFLSRVQQHIGQTPMDKPAQTVAQEVTQNLLEGLLLNKPDALLLSVYHRWLDSNSAKSSFLTYLKAYTPSTLANPWNVHPDHPFGQVDLLQLQDVVAHLHDRSKLTKWLPAMQARAKNRYARLMQLDWWEAVVALIQFDAKGIQSISSFADAIKFYKESFVPVDRAMRQLLAEFLSNAPLIKPLQEYYHTLVGELLEKWFYYFEDYGQTQQGLLNRIIDNRQGPIAIIVGDGVTYEIADKINRRVGKDLKTTADHFLADLPSVTDNNMSRLYRSDGSWVAEKAERERYLKAEFPKLSIAFVDLEDINHSLSGHDVVICSYKDIDDMGEKLQQKALKFLDTVIDTVSSKIKELEKIGFPTIHLVTDHGFVLTGLISDSDKIEVKPTGASLKTERFIACAERQTTLPAQLLEVKSSYKEFSYLYFAKNLRSFKTPGKYGYAHGGASLQELVVPHFTFTSPHVVKTLEVVITDKAALKDVVGENFVIRLQAGTGDGGVFSAQRKCKLLIYNNGKEIGASDVISLSVNESASREYSFEKKPELDIILVDATTRAQLDKVVVKKSSIRDLGGLL
ncbi:hypothetical protein [Larkinella sp. C7]|uniref:hypothetical protein n=1 Tax=Larkinella sp. C7 TaxID=2576607 RepID=UPI001111358C|nr:hypothetical protein [Larkinella sp. C7]